MRRARNVPAEAKLWSKVAVAIADRSRRQIGEKVSDRYEAEPAVRSAAEREVVAGLVDIAAGIVDLAHGRGNATSLHNVQVRVLQLVDLANGDDQVRHLAAELSRRLEAVEGAKEENRSALADGIYPPKAEMAGEALQQFRAALTCGPEPLSSERRWARPDLTKTGPPQLC